MSEAAESAARPEQSSLLSKQCSTIYMKVTRAWQSLQLGRIRDRSLRQPSDAQPFVRGAHRAGSLTGASFTAYGGIAQMSRNACQISQERGSSAGVELAAYGSFAQP